MKKILYGLVVLLSVLWAADTAWAECRVLSVDPTYTAGSLKDLTCGLHGALAVGGGTGSATAAAPTYVEGSPGSFSFDLSGDLRVTQGTLLAGEDQVNNALATEGAAVRGTVGNMATAVTTNTTSTAVALPTGSKSIYGSVAGTGAVTQTQKIYSGITSGVTATTGILMCTLTLSGTTTAVDQCPVITAAGLFWIVVTSATTGTGATGVVTAMY